MKYVVCDKCHARFAINGKEPVKTIKLPFEYACSAWQVNDYDLCEKCRKELEERVIQAKVNFIKDVEK